MALLDGKRVAFLLTDGFEDSELTAPWEAARDAGAEARLVSPASGTVTGEHGYTQAVDASTRATSADDFDALVLPGGVGNADALRLDAEAVRVAHEFFAQHKPVAVICHGAWILADADVLSGRTLTSYPSLKTDLVNAGATWVDEQVVVDQGLVSSRTPDDLPAFTARMIEEIAEGPHSGQTT
ncbi:type 1 glutamine amidotransferase domain-containing protein [Microbacterium excoecariae]|uniref:type 1 glutamine amidotransferase domain-containing protein n=1 Tax=Microbacterium excoecariae TaxID=2715210 RepID=UPI00140732C8|nr:type 1 glutamine amidotransferase domain-containing protein [Microbacterium excoecariae]NHI16697.1 type 1 glutamine amidotransferase [Microbacterium excoecariae]